MRLILISLILWTGLSSISIAQGDLIKTHQKLLSFKQAKLTLGVGVDFGGGSLYRYEGSNPIEGEILNPLFFSGAALLDLYAPKSRLSFAFGGEWNYFNYTYSAFSNQKFYYNDVTLQYLKFPLLLKLSLGNKFSVINVVLFGGASYDVPFMYKDSSTLTNMIIHSDRKILKSSYSGIAGLAFQINFRGKTRQDYYVPLYEQSGKVNYVKVVFPRIWITFKATRSLINYYNTSYTVPIFENKENSELDAHDLRFSFGFMFFLGSNKKHEVE